jgi:hypothetical protein
MLLGELRFDPGPNARIHLTHGLLKQSILMPYRENMMHNFNISCKFG